MAPEPDRPAAPAGSNGDGDGPPDSEPAGSPASARLPAPGALPPRPEPPDEDSQLERNPVIPDELLHPINTARATLSWVLHVTRFHLAHLHRYVARAVVWTPRGAARMIRGLYRWGADIESARLLAENASSNQTADYVKLSREHDAHMHERRWFAALGIAAIPTWFAVALALTLTAPDPAVRLAAALALTVWVAVCGWAGQPGDRHIIDPATTETGARRITPHMVVEAFEAAGLAKPPTTNTPGKPIRFVTDIARVGRDGQQTVIDLPLGYTFQEAVQKRAKIASGLSVAKVQLFLSSDPESERRVRMYVHDFDPYAKPSPVTPLAKATKFDLWQPVPFGTDAKGGQVAFPLPFTNVLIGSIPRMGKSNAALLLAAAAALDPYARMVVWNGKGDRAYEPLERICHRYGAGVRDHAVAALDATLTEAVEDMNDRYDRIRRLPAHQCPDNHLTPELAADRSLDMPLTVIVIDEVHRYIQHPVFGKRILASLVDLVKVGPAAGYILVAATQKPESRVIPDSLRGQMGTRFALKVMTFQASETILGAGTYPAGLDASQFQPNHKGVGILLGADDSELSERGGQTVRTYLIDGPTLTEICNRAHRLRNTLGLLTGDAAGDNRTTEDVPHLLLEHILDEFSLGEERLHSEVLIARMAERHPARYDGFTPTQLANMLHRFGVFTEQMFMTVDGERRNRRGVWKDHVIEALERRLKAQAQGPVDSPVSDSDDG